MGGSLPLDAKIAISIAVPAEVLFLYCFFRYCCDCGKRNEANRHPYNTNRGDLEYAIIATDADFN